ncbi:hypothetical protein PV08_07587 [Exophiala spinifera]|uniref:VWFA domain-containing protein n=1 Tax=Exophiala spinifera TaxID=91928 RepID=A0A0D1ZPQ9_9EURO|nr:uncharacterized protein PV08_07587 [Exophiala spinifera]KIW14802.1 hypothetical protein PV08_07587 [Exophiala spinifera]
MSHHFRIERLPSGMHFPGPPRKLIYQPELGKKREIPPRDSQVPSEYDGFPFPKFPFANFAAHKVTSSKSPAPAWSKLDEPPTLCLPLLQVSVEVLVDGTIAHTILTQSFNNASNESIPKVQYTFPLYDGAVVTSFRCSIEGRILVGEVKPKEQARGEFEKAVKMKHAAALLEEHTPEIFETTVGNVPPSAIVKVEIAYVSELRVALRDDTKEGLDVVIPMSIAPRYGTAAGTYSTHHNFEDDGLDIVIKVKDSGTIQDIKSPTHRGRVKVRKNVVPKSTEVQSFDQLGTKSTTTQMVATFESHSSIMDEDFVLAIEMPPSHPLRSRAVLSPSNQAGHAALMVNVKPNEVFNGDFQAQNFDGEVIFVLDRSESMGWSTNKTGGYQSDTTKIGTLRQAMPLSLVSLPVKCAFNIVSFGTHSQFLWDKSKPYSEANRDYAMKYVRTVKADMGGTEMMFAIQQAVESRSTDRCTTQIIIITDGELDPEKVIDYVRKTRRELQSKIRFFALGIGDQVSHRLIESIGEFGGGYGEVINLRANRRWDVSLSRMLKAGLTPDSWTLEISLGAGFQRRSLVNYQLGERPQEKLLVPYIQAPYPSPSLHPFTYHSIFFLLDIGMQPPPAEVILRPTNAGTKPEAEHFITVEQTWTNKSTIHHLAVKAALVELEAEINREAPEESQSYIGGSNAEKLGATYSIVSKWTSFVAVDQENKDFHEIDMSKAEMIDIDIEDLESNSEDMGSDLAMIGSSDEDSSCEYAFGPGAPPRSRAKPPIHILPNTADGRKPRADRSIGSSSFPVLHRDGLSTDGSFRTSPPKRGTTVNFAKNVNSWRGVKDVFKRTLKPAKLFQRRRSKTGDNEMYDDYEAESDYEEEGGYEGGIDYQEGGGSQKGGDCEEGCEAGAEIGAYEPCRYSSEDNLEEPEASRDVSDDSITLMDAVDVQDRDGIFHLPRSLRETLQRHFCPGTSTSLVATLAQISTVPPLSNRKRRTLADTLMMIQYFKVHAAQERDLWELMMDKAEYAVRQALQLSGEDEEEEAIFASLGRITDGASKHMHFLTTIDPSEERSVGSFPPSRTIEVCPSCGTNSEVEDLVQRGKRRDGSRHQVRHQVGSEPPRANYRYATLPGSVSSHQTPQLGTPPPVTLSIRTATTAKRPRSRREPSHKPQAVSSSRTSFILPLPRQISVETRETEFPSRGPRKSEKQAKFRE